MAEIPEEEIRIIEFSEDDAEELSQLFKEIWPQELDYPEVWRKRRMYSPEKIIEELRSGYHYFGSRLKGEIVGVYKTKITEKGLLGEQQTVRRECRDTGLASAMYSQFIEYARQHNCKRNYCNILVGQKVGIRLMKKYGFVPWGEPYEQIEGMWVQMYERPVDV